MKYFRIGLCLLISIISTSLVAQQINEVLPNGTRVNAQFWPAKENQPTVLLIHPLLQTYNFSTIASLTESLVDNGIGVLTPNLSLGIDNRRQSLECEAIHTQTMRQDIDETGFWVGWLQHEVNTPIIAIGHSTGALQVLGYDNEHIKFKVLINPVAVGPDGATAIDTQQLEAAREDKEKGNPDKLGQYKFSYCNNYVTTRNNYLELTGWDEERVSQHMADEPYPVHIILGSDDYKQNQSWLSNIDSPGIHLHIIEGGNHFFSGTEEFDLQDKVLEILQAQ